MPVINKNVTRPECPKSGKSGLEGAILTKCELQKAGKERREYSRNYLPILISIKNVYRHKS